VEYAIPQAGIILLREVDIVIKQLAISHL
jgi:hypothetical protein